MVNNSVITFVFIAFCLSLFAQSIEPYNKALVWRGMEHKWTYNHRINRMGNYLLFDGINGYSLHSSATGLGKDSSYSKTYYSYVESPNIIFKEIFIEIQIEGKEGDLLDVQKEYSYELEHWISGMDHYDAFINGFEIISLQKADQLQLFKVNIEKPELAPDRNTLKIKANINLVTNCKSIECQMLNKKTGYTIKIPILLLAFNEIDAHITDTYKSLSYDWNKSEETIDYEKPVAISGDDSGFPKSCIGIKGFGIVLNKQHWLLEHKSFIIPKDYNSETGIMRSSINMTFHPWKKEMKQSTVAPFKAKLAKKKRGFAILDMNISMLQMKIGQIKHKEVHSTQYWGGRNQDSNSTEAQRIINISEHLNFNWN